MTSIINQDQALTTSTNTTNTMTTMNTMTTTNTGMLKEVNFYKVGEDVDRFKNDATLGPLFDSMKKLAAMAATKPHELEKIRQALVPAKGDVMCELLRELITGIQKATEANMKVTKKVTAPKTNATAWITASPPFAQNHRTTSNINDAIIPHPPPSRQGSLASNKSNPSTPKPMNPYSPRKPRDIEQEDYEELQDDPI